MAKTPVTIRVQFNNLTQLRGQLRREAANAVRETTLAIEAGAKERMTQPKSGRVYERPGQPAHQASAPGEAPAVDTSTLSNSVQSRMDGDLTGVIEVGAEQGEALEYGTERIEPRPYMTPSAEEERPRFTKRMEKLLDG
ncbi:MAG: hypothetical protein M3P51_04570 [Chloroflexota bacterium]|nr:hypothetical protein [Chloroflexota bacterium]